MEFILTDDNDDQEMWLNTLKAFLSLNCNSKIDKDPPQSDAALFIESPAPSPVGSRSNSPLSRNSLPRSRLSLIDSNDSNEDSVFNFQSVEFQISPTKSPTVDSTQSQTCHQLLHSFLATYQHLLTPLTRKYPYLDTYITVLYGCVELHKISGYLCDVIEKACKSYLKFDAYPIHTEMSKLNFEALSLLRLLKELLSCTVLNSSQIDSLKDHMVDLANESAVLVKSVLQHAIVLVSPPNRALDSRILTGLITDWTMVNESLYAALSKISNTAAASAPKIKRNPTGHTYSSSLTSLTHKHTLSIGSGPNDQFRKIHASLIEMSNTGVPGDAKQLIVKSLQYCLNQDAVKLLDNLVTLLFEVKNEKTVDIYQLSAELASDAQELLTLLSSA